MPQTPVTAITRPIILTPSKIHRGRIKKLTPKQILQSLSTAVILKVVNSL